MTPAATGTASDAVKFLVVGVVGIVVNVLTTWTTHELTGGVLLSAGVGMAVSVVTNFLMLEHWVFHDRAVGRLWGRFGGFVAIGVVDFALRAPFLRLLEPYIGIAAATVLTLSVVFVIRFIVSKHLLWRPAPAENPSTPLRRGSSVSIDQGVAQMLAKFPDILRPGDVGDIFGVSSKTVIRWAEKGRIRSFRTLGRHHRFHKEDIVQLLEQDSRPSTLSEGAL